MTFVGKKRAIANKAKGLCSCGNSPRPGKRSCEICAERMRRGSKEYKKRLREQGICLHCMTRPVDQDKTLCLICLERSNTAGKSRYRLRVDSGLCLTCPKPATDGHHCDDCAGRVREYDKKRSKGKPSRFAKKQLSLGLCIDCSSPHIEGKTVCFEHDRKRKLQAQLGRLFLKEKVLAHYGKACNWSGCDVSDPDMLTLDHINDDGSKDRAADLYRRIVKAGFPDTFQVLCWNHQWKKRIRKLRERIPLPRVNL